MTEMSDVTPMPSFAVDAVGAESGPFDFDKYQSQEKPSVTFDSISAASPEPSAAGPAKPQGFFAKARTIFASKPSTSSPDNENTPPRLDDFELKAILQDLTRSVGSVSRCSSPSLLIFNLTCDHLFRDVPHKLCNFNHSRVLRANPECREALGLVANVYSGTLSGDDCLAEVRVSLEDLCAHVSMSNRFVSNSYRDCFQGSKRSLLSQA
jgi:hypothetical protein